MGRDFGPRECTLCHCRQHRWDGRPRALLMDRYSTCECGHATVKHRFGYQREEVANEPCTPPSSVA